ncbi:cellulose binding domain-containing protein, partial [Herbiconiux moechotypicola]
TTPKPTTPAITAKWMLQSAWGEGYVADVEITPSSIVSGWTVSWKDSSVTGVVNSWGVTCTVKAKTSITCTGSDWAAAPAPGQTVRVGLQVASTKAPSSPTVTTTAK